MPKGAIPTGRRAIIIVTARPRYGRTLGLISIPGDRRDDDIRAMGAIAGQVFDKLFFREDPSTRGRPRGEIMDLLAEGALSVGVDRGAIHQIVHERDATEACLRAARPGDLVVLTPTEVEETWQQVLAFKSPFAQSEHVHSVAA